MTSQSDNSNRIQAVRVTLTFAAVIVTLMTSSGVVQMQAKKPYDKDTLLRVVQLNVLQTAEIVEHVQQRGVEFRLTADTESEN